ncbi:hypothetical protein C2845_PM06G26450 [Panicum miliaceum]|uniref:Uncharacterized protein n=1 Tax=Panicum miliaceum TaxID=4540 RepID=A0A3L6RCY4_PANMI|nr:hypothetical protein C2845_PM06G26450 [Panicum miliaceum]
MVGKKGASKVKGKESNPAATAGNRWRKFPKITGGWTGRAPELSQVNEVLTKIMVLRDDRVTEVSVVYSLIGRRIQPLQQRTRFGFKYMGLKDPSQFSTEQIHQAKALKPVRDDVNVYRSMPPMPNIDFPSHLMPSTRPLAIAATIEKEEGDETDDNRTLAEVIKGKSMKTS